VEPTALLLDETGAAKLLGMKPRTLSAWRHRGGGPEYVRISSRCVRYPVAALEAWIADRATTSTSAATVEAER
jgi:predicted DNA-binding transcriptional regulator AlpA